MEDHKLLISDREKYEMKLKYCIPQTWNADTPGI